MDLPKNKKIFVPVDPEGNPLLIFSIPVSKKVPSREKFLVELKGFLEKQLSEVDKDFWRYGRLPEVNECVDYADQRTKNFDWNKQTFTPTKFQSFIRVYFKKRSLVEFLNEFNRSSPAQKIVNKNLEANKGYQKFMLMKYSGKKEFERYLEKAFMDKAIGVNWLEGFKLENLNLNSIKSSDHNFSRGKLKNFNFSGSDIENFIFNDGSLIKVSFHRARLNKCGFINSKFSKAHFLDSDILRSQFNKAKMEGSHFQYARIIMGDFVKANLNGSDFRYSVAVECDFRGAKLKGVNFQGAILSGSSFERANLENANFCGSKLSGVLFKGARLSNIKIDHNTKLPEGIDKKMKEKFKVV